MSYACIDRYHGEPAILIDGEPFPPMAMTTRIAKPDYIRQLRDAGIRIFFLMANTSWLRPGRTWTDEDGVPHEEPNGFDAFREEAERLLAAAPDAYIIVRIGMHPPVDWMEAHPDDIVRYSDGGTMPAIIASEVHSDKVPGMYSLCSDAWRQDGAVALEDFCRSVDALPFADRVIGYFLGAGGTSEWYSVNPLIDHANGRVADYSPAFRREFGRILREQYGTEEALRAAWGQPDATFDAPLIPTLEERQYTYVDGKILHAMYFQESAGRSLDADIQMNPDEGNNVGVFLNANCATHVADFYRAWHLGTANTIVHFAEVIKAHDPGKLVGAFYGSYGCTNYFDGSTAAGTTRILDAGVVDFLASPGVYNNREPGGCVAQRQMQDSFRLRGQMFLSEEDSRTHLETPFYRDSMGLYEVDDALHTLKRDFARNLCEDTYAWWFDQHADGGRYEHPAFYELFRRQTEIARFAYGLDRRKVSEIALIYDQESLHYVSQYTNEYLLDYYRTSDLARIGAPVDYYFHNDLARDDMPDYKLYLMLNTFVLSDAEREAIHRKAAKNGAVVVWLYAPGFINPDRPQKIANRNIEELIGMRVGRIDDTLSPRFRLTAPDHPALRYGDPDRIYGYIDRDVHSNVWLQRSVLHPPYMNPGFYIDDPDAAVLGRYCNDRRAALALKTLPEGYTSIYCAPHILRAELIASFAAYAGCHLYAHDDDVLYASRSFVTVHAAYTGTHTLHFPQPCSPFEVYERRCYGHNLTTLALDMHLGETKMFSLAGEC